MRRIDLTGARFGNVVVLGLDDDRNKLEKGRCMRGEITKAKLHWKCRCELCGNEFTVCGDNLRSGNTTSCGCERADRLRKAARKENKFVFRDGYCAVMANNTGTEFQIDFEDYELVRKYGWHETPYGYLAARIPSKKKIGFLHRSLVFGEDNMENDAQVDHINRNTRDCRKGNLRACTGIENSHNKAESIRNTSGHIGVYYRPTEQNWQAAIRVEGKTIVLGRFDSFDEAVIAREIAERQYYGRFAPIR